MYTRKTKQVARSQRPVTSHQQPESVRIDAQIIAIVTKFN